MTNNQFCSILGVSGIFIAFMSMGLIFFGVSSAIWGAITGFTFAGIGLVNFD